MNAGGPAGGRDGDFELVTLRSGARAVRHVGHGEVMHPAVGPWEEANQLYVDQLELVRHLTRPVSEPLRILDVGLGAATNAAAVLTCAAGIEPRRAIELCSLELDLAPLRLALGDPAGFPYLTPLAGMLESLMREGRVETQHLRWTLLLGDARDTLERAPNDHDLVLFDPFSPKSNPTLWTPEFLSRVRAHCRLDDEGARIATYSAATPTRVSFLLAGFFVGAGAPTGTKGETTLAATRLESLRQPLGKRWLERWERSSARAPHGGVLTPELEVSLRAHPQFEGVAAAD